MFLKWKYGQLIYNYKLGEGQELVQFELNTCKGGRQRLVHYGRVTYHQDKDRDNGLISRDVHGWWIVGGISRKATKITIGRGDQVLY